MLRCVHMSNGSQMYVVRYDAPQFFRVVYEVTVADVAPGDKNKRLQAQVQIWSQPLRNPSAL